MKKIAARFVGLHIFLLVIVVAHAQPACKIEHYSTEDGLSHDIITYIYKDREGFMWFGTWNGLNRFDGRRFVSFKSLPGDSSQLKNDRVDHITEDDFQHLWVKAYDGQVYRFDKKTERFLSLAAILKIPVGNQLSFRSILSTSHGRIWIETVKDGLMLVSEPQSDSSRFFTYQAGAANGFSLPSNKINFFKEDRTGAVWVGTQEGLACLVKNENGIYTNEKVQMPAGNITCVTESENAVYFGTADGRIMCWDRLQRQFDSFAITGSKLNALLLNRAGTALYATSVKGELLVANPKGTQVKKYVNQRPGALFTMYEDRFGNLWIKPEKDGVVRFDVRTNRLKDYRQKNNSRYNYTGDHFKVYEDNLGILWVNLKGGGFGYYDTVTDAIEYFYNEPNTASRRFSNIVNSLYYDPTGLLWLRTEERGIEKITFLRNEFHQQLLVNPGTFQSDNEVRGLMQDRLNRLWVGVKGGHLYVLQDGRELQGLFVNLPQNGLGLVYTILQDRTGAIWLGTKANGLYKAMPINEKETKYRLHHYQHDPGDVNSISSNEIYSLAEDKAGRIWVGSFDQGLNMVRPGTDNPVFIHDNHSLQDYPATRFRKIRHMVFDKKDRLWLATTDGLLIVNTGNPGKFSFASYQKAPGDMESLGKNDIQYIYRDSKDQMWLATSGGGLNKAIGNDPMYGLRFRVYTTKQGLPNDYLVSCVEDKQGNLWIATQAGLSKLDPGEKLFRNYNSYDGVPKFSFSEGSCARLHDGKLLFGTIKGFVSFDPAGITNHPMQANLVFTNLQINNKDVTVDGADILKAGINHTGSLMLRHNQNIVSIDFQVLDFRSGGKPVYAYRLKGFDTAWHYNLVEQRATYTNLPPGQYVFEVKCNNRDLYSNLPLKSLSINILPPWWKTWWAWLLYIISTLLAMAMIRRIALTMLRLRQKIALEKKLAAMKLNFFTNVSHELRTPVTLIINPIEEIYKHERLSERGRQYMEVVRKNASRMGRFVNQLLELRKLQSGKSTLSVSKIEMVAFVKSIATYFAEMARAKQIDLRVESASQQIEASIDIDKIETVIYNLVANAFKFTPPGSSIIVRVNGSDGPGQIFIEVCDQGPGVHPDRLDKIFELFYEDQGANAKAGEGTGIGLALAREIIELHEGKIEAVNNPRGGLTVRIQLPTQVLTPQNDTIRINNSETPPASDASQEDMLKAVEDLGNSRDRLLILLVEDNTDLQFFLKSQLAAHYRVEIAANGEEGWQKAQELLPDLVLSDIMMPKMDGIKMLDKLKTGITTSHIPVILLTAKSAVESQIEGLEYGADYYITKPFHHDFLLAAILNLIKQRKKILEALLHGKKWLKLEPGEIQVTSQDEIFLKKVLAIVEEKMIDIDFDIDTIAGSVGMGRTTFYKKFKSLTGLAPVEFVKEIRLQRAKQYLDAEQGNISEIAYSVGFNNAKYFSTCFKSRYAVSPSDYIKKKSATTEQDCPDNHSGS